MLNIKELTDVNVGEWQRDYLFKVSIVEIPAGAVGNLPAGFNPDLLDLYCISAPFPESKIKTIEQKWAGQRDFWAGPIDTSGELEGTFRFDQKCRAYDYFDVCKQLASKDESGAGAPKWLYIGSYKFSLVDVDKETILASWIIKGAWVTELSTLDTDKTKEGILTFKAKLAYRERGKLKNP